jgi:hypothetical protein
LRDLRADGRITLKWTSEFADLEWIRITQDRIQWRILVDTAMKMEFYLKIEKLRGRSPQTNYTDRATGACQRS